MIRKVILPILLVVFVVSIAHAATPVSQHYFVDEYIAMKAYHKQVGKIFKEDPNDKAILAFALNLLQNDLAAFQNMTPPESYREMHVRVIAAIKNHIAALQLALKGDTEKAKKRWKRGNGNLQWVDAFLMQRDWKIDNIPVVDPMFKPTDAQLTNEQYADRYFLIRVMNQKIDADLCKKSTAKKGGAGIDQAERMVDAQLQAWKVTQYPKKMKGVHEQVLKGLQLSKEWVDLVQAGNCKDAKTKEGQIVSIYKKVDNDLKADFNIQVPDFIQDPG
jgi:hypothetical protein